MVSVTIRGHCTHHTNGLCRAWSPHGLFETQLCELNTADARSLTCHVSQLEADESDVDAQVTEPDQTNINRFSRLNSRTDELESELEVLNKQVEDVEEVETEMELMDEDELVM